MEIMLSITVVAFSFLIILQAYELDKKQNYIRWLERKILKINSLNVTAAKNVVVERTEQLK